MAHAERAAEALHALPQSEQSEAAVGPFGAFGCICTIITDAQDEKIAFVPAFDGLPMSARMAIGIVEAFLHETVGAEAHRL